MKKAVAILIALVFVLSFAVNATASGPQSIIIGNAKFAEKGEEQIMTIEAKDLDSITVINLVLKYDSTKVELLNVAEEDGYYEEVIEGETVEIFYKKGQVRAAAGEFTKDTYICRPEEGIITLIWENHKSISGSGVVANLSFKALTDDAGIQKLEYTEYEDEYGLNDSFVCRDNDSNLPVRVDADFLEKPIATVSGTVTSFLDENGTVTVGLYEGENAEPSYETTMTGNNGTYSIPEVWVGTYTMKVSKEGHATFTKEIVVETEDVEENFTIYQYGDINGDGNVKANDKTWLARYLAEWVGYETLPVYEAVADLNGDGLIKANDKTVLARYLAEWSGYETLPKK